MKQKKSIEYILANNTILFLFCIWICNLPLQAYAQKSNPCINQIQAVEKPFSFGVIADIQYADKDSLRGRCYRAAINKLRECVTDLNERNLTFTIQLGDIIDGHKENLAKTHQDLDSVIGAVNHLVMPLYHVIGNHDMIAGKEYLEEYLEIKKFYYDFTVPSAKGWRFIVLDGNDGGYGIISNSQIAWFRETLNQVERNGERVICFCHYALVADSNMHHYMAQPEPIFKIMDNTHCVVAWFAGHDHKGGYVYRNGVHYVTVKGMVEVPIENSYATVEVFSDKIQITGIGKEENRKLQFKNITKQ